MTYDDFVESCKSGAAEPGGLTAELRALRLDRLENWDAAHHAAQESETPNSAWVHAYLHRKEGDISNARYWYNRADRPESKVPLEQEWEGIVRELLGE